MDYQTAILLYSNYSSISKQLIQNLEQTHLDVLKLQTICVDNEHIRKRILKSKTINITTIPSLLLIYNNGGVEKYDGQQLFNLLEVLMKKYLPQPQPQPQSQPQPQLPPPLEPTSTEKLPSKKQSKKVPKVKPHPMETKMQDLDSEEEDNEIERPPAIIRNGPGGYDVSTEFINEEEDKMDNIAKNVQKINQSKTGLMATAMAMQKERDNK